MDESEKEITMVKTWNIRNILLPAWTQEDDLYGTCNEKEVTQEHGTNLEHFLEVDESPLATDWIPVVKSWTPEMTVKAWPMIDWIIRNHSEIEAAEWVCTKSTKFFTLDLTSNL